MSDSQLAKAAKRKRSDASDPPKSSKRLRRIQAKGSRTSNHKRTEQNIDLKHVIDTQRTLLQRVLKHCREFEKRKLHKKAKEAKEESEIAKVAQQQDALKALQLDILAGSHLRSTLLKDERMGKNALLVEELGEAPTHTRDPARDAILGRLFAYKQVLTATKNAAASVQKRLQLTEYKSQDTSPEESQSEESDGEHRDIATGEQRDSEHPTNISDEEDGTIDLDDDILAKMSARVAGSSSEDESGDEHDFLRSSSEDEEDEVERSEDEWEGLPDSPPPAPRQVKDRNAPRSIARNTAKKAKTEDTRPAASAFLPSLTVGGYFSGSEDDDFEDKKVVKKNRKGQAARRAEAESRYGRRAKHLQKQNGDTRNDGWDSTRGAQLDGNSQRGGRRGGGQTQNRQAASKAFGRGTNGHDAPAQPAEKKDDKPIHPSWEARKHLKSQQKAVLSSFAGKKMTFD